MPPTKKDVIPYLLPQSSYSIIPIFEDASNPIGASLGQEFQII